jgi:hypothetical protein
MFPGKLFMVHLRYVGLNICDYSYRIKLPGRLLTPNYVGYEAQFTASSTARVHTRGQTPTMAKPDYPRVPNGPSSSHGNKSRVGRTRV